MTAVLDEVATPTPAPAPATPVGAARRLVHAYYMVVVSTGLLLGIGLLMTVSSHVWTALSGSTPESPYQQGLWQGIYIVIGLVGAWLASRWPARWWQFMACSVLLVACVAQAFVPIKGRGIGGNTNWLVFGSIGGHEISVQPSEFLKLGLALFLGIVLANKAPVLDRWGKLAMPALLGIVIAIGLVGLGKDLGTMAVIGLMSLGTLIAAGVPWGKLCAIGVVCASCAGAVSLFYARAFERWSTLLNPEAASAAEGAWQIRQASYALAQGSILGTGLGTSREKWGFLSQAESDFIFAIIGEEFGLVGSVIVLGLFGVLAIGLFQIVRLHPSRSAQVTTAAIACWLCGQAVINIAMVVRLLPVVGVPLPFVSAGGSALVASVAAIGVVIGLMRSDPQVGPALRARPRILGRAGSVAAWGHSRRPRS